MPRARPVDAPTLTSSTTPTTGPLKVLRPYRDRRKAIPGQTKFSPEAGEKIAQVVAAGNYVETAAAFVGVAKETLWAWLRAGRQYQTDPRYLRGTMKARGRELAAFVVSVEKAQAQSEVRDSSLIAKHGEKEWSALAWRLERRSPSRWGRKDYVRITVDRELENALAVLRSALPPEWYEVALAALASVADGGDEAGDDSLPPRRGSSPAR